MDRRTHLTFSYSLILKLERTDRTESSVALLRIPKTKRMGESEVVAV